jgi:hypothetical protein
MRSSHVLWYGTLLVLCGLLLLGCSEDSGRNEEAELPGEMEPSNLTPEPTTGLRLNQEQFFQTLQFGADFRRREGSLRIPPHFPVSVHFTRDDLQAVYAYLRAIPPIVNAVEIVP